MSYFIYILECSNNSFYVGYTTNLNRRYREHCAGTTKCKYTRSFPPIAIAASWKFDMTLSDILKIEHALKKLSHSEKKQLVNNRDTLFNLIM